MYVLENLCNLKYVQFIAHSPGSLQKSRAEMHNRLQKASIISHVFSAEKATRHTLKQTDGGVCPIQSSEYYFQKCGVYYLRTQKQRQHHLIETIMNL